MSISLTAYRKIEFVRPLRDGEEGDEEWPALLHLYPSEYAPEVADGLREGLYRAPGDWQAALDAHYKGAPDDPDQLFVDCGSNEGFEDWLNELADVLPEDADGIDAFLEINYWQSMTLFGAKTSALLGPTFEAHLAAAEEHAKALDAEDHGAGELFLRPYLGFLRGFQMAAAGGGAVWVG